MDRASLDPIEILTDLAEWKFEEKTCPVCKYPGEGCRDCCPVGRARETHGAEDSVIHYFCGTCGAPYIAVFDRYTKAIRAEPTCLKYHPLCIRIGTEEEAEILRATYADGIKHHPAITVTLPKRR